MITVAAKGRGGVGDTHPLEGASNLLGGGSMRRIVVLSLIAVLALGIIVLFPEMINLFGK
jgi:hypothetical protein